MRPKGFTATPLGTVVVLLVTTALILGGLWLVKGRGSSSTGGGPVAADDAGSPSTAAAAPKVGEPAADFTATDIEGAKVSLADLRGRPVWLVFGATWCRDCRSETVDVEAVQQALGNKATIVAIYVGDDQTAVQGYADRLGLTYTHVADPDSALGDTYRVMGVPTHHFIAPDGTTAEIKVGPLTKSTALDILNGLLG